MNESKFEARCIEAEPVTMRFRSAAIPCRWEPKPDITSYELAQLIPFFHGQWMTEEKWAELGDATRHLIRVEMPQ